MNVLKSAARAGLAMILAGSLTPLHASEDSEIVCTRDDFTGCLNGVTSSVTNGAGLRVSGAEYGEVARERSGRQTENAQAALTTGGGPLAAGDEVGMAGSVFALWGSYSYSNFDSDFAFQGTSLAYDAEAHNALVGVDRLFGERFLLGLAAGYQWVDADTDFNGGSQENDGYTFAPYAAVLLNDTFSIDVSGGMSWLDYDQDRISPADGTDIAASFDAERWFVATNLNMLVMVENWVIGGKLGYLYTEEEQDRYLETGSAASAAAGRLRTVQQRNVDLSQIIVGLDLGYSFGAFEPYLMVAYHNDLSRDNDNRAGGLPGNFTSVQPGDDDEIQLSGGVRLYTTWGLSTTLEYQRVENRKNFDSDAVLLTLRAAL